MKARACIIVPQGCTKMTFQTQQTKDVCKTVWVPIGAIIVQVLDNASEGAQKILLSLAIPLMGSEFVWRCVRKELSVIRAQVVTDSAMLAVPMDGLLRMTTSAGALRDVTQPPMDITRFVSLLKTVPLIWLEILIQPSAQICVQSKMGCLQTPLWQIYAWSDALLTILSCTSQTLLIVGAEIHAVILLQPPSLCSEIMTL